MSLTFFDFGDTIPLIPEDPIFDSYGKSLAEKNKCLIIHLEASLLPLRSQRVTEMGILEVGKEEVNRFSSEIRSDQFKQAQECNVTMGEPDTCELTTVAELRHRAHDILTPNHDRGYKSLICFPPTRMGSVNVLVLIVPPSHNLPTHIIQSAVPSKTWLFFVAYQGHLRVMIPCGRKADEFLLTRPSTISRPLGWQHLFEFPGGKNFIETKSLARCPLCQIPNSRLPEGVFGTIVGRSQIATDVQLREFVVGKPWTRAAAEEHGHEALACWGYEGDTPNLDFLLNVAPLRPVFCLSYSVRFRKRRLVSVWKCGTPLRITLKLP